jgi:hypothetical protein
MQMQYALPRPARVQLSVMDIQGREIATPVDGLMEAGRHVATWTGETHHGKAPSGIYFVRFRAAGMEFVRRVVVAR